MLDDPRFAALFAPGSRAEVPIVGRIEGRTVTGVVDRLVVTPDAVLIADYKTNRPAPRSLAETQEHYQGYIRQLCALSRRADAALSGPAGPRRFGVDGHSRPGGNSRQKRWMRRSQPSPPRDPP